MSNTLINHYRVLIQKICRMADVKTIKQKLNLYMKKINFIFTIMTAGLLLLISCNQIGDNEKENSDQTIIDTLLKKYYTSYNSLPNDAQKIDYKKKYLDTIRTYLSDTLKYKIGTFKVHVKSISNSGDMFSDIKGFTAEFTNNGNTFYTEFDYKKNEYDNKIKANPVYLLVKNLKEGTDTTLSFYYYGDLEWDNIYTGKLKIDAIPVGKDFDFSYLKNKK